MDLHRLGVKFFVEEPGSVDLLGLIPVFHSWIQGQTVEDHLLVDVHDYSHVNGGPGILLVAHEGNFSMDMAEDRPGLFYCRKEPLDGSLPERLQAIFTTALKACRMLEESPTLAGLRFKTDEITIVANDRLVAPNTKETFETLQPALDQFLRDLFQIKEIALTHSGNPKDRLTILAAVSDPRDIQTLLERLG